MLSLIKDAYIKDKNVFDETKLISYGSEVIKLGLGCCGAEDDFKIYSKRFDVNSIKEIFSNLMK